jgi:type II secretory pathway pseudopilin PulG
MTPMSRPDSTEGGLTLIEVLIAAVLLGMVALVVFATFGLGLRAAWMAQELETASSLAEEALLHRIAEPCGASLRRADLPELPAALAHRYRRQVEVTRLDTSGLWEIRSTVTWTRSGGAHRIALVTRRHVSAACALGGQ